MRGHTDCGGSALSTLSVLAVSGPLAQTPTISRLKSSGISDPLAVIEQIRNLRSIRRLDELR